MTEKSLTASVRADSATVSQIVPLLREYVDGVAFAIVMERAELGGMPWQIEDGDDAETCRVKNLRCTLEILKVARAKTLLLEGASCALAILYETEIESVVKVLGPYADWDGSAAGLDLIIEESTPDHATGDARGKRQFARDTVPVLRAVGVSDADIMEIAAKPSMRGRLAAAINQVIRNDLAPDEREEQVRQAALDAQTMTTREFDAQWKDSTVDVIEYDEECLARDTGVWRRVYLLSDRQRALMDSALRARQRKVDMPFERVPTLALVRRAMEDGDWRRVIVAALPADAFAVLETIERWGATNREQLSINGGGTARQVERAAEILEECGLVRQNNDGLWEVAECGG